MNMKQITGKAFNFNFVILLVLITSHACYSQSSDKPSVQFKKHTLTREFISEGVAAFGPVIKVYEAEEMQQKYNSKVHPILSASSKLLMSYNINVFDFSNELKANSNLYLPPVIKLKLN